MLEDDDLVAGFEAGTLEEFHHADHVQLTIIYLSRLGRDRALDRLNEGLRRFATSKGHPEKFHVTMTRAWLELIEGTRNAHPGIDSAEALIAACPALLDRHALDRCYSRERLESERARTEWIAPDLGPLHHAVDAVPRSRTDLTS